MIEIFIGLIAGIIGGLGMGGGTILILLLSIFSNIEQHIAQGSNAIFFIPMSIAALIVFIKNKNVNLKLAIPICIGGILGAAIGATISSRMDMSTLRKYFGIFLIIIAIYQIYYLYKMYKNKKTRNNSIK